MHCTVHGLKYVPVASIIWWQLQDSDWASVVTFGGAPNCDLANSLDGAYLGPFNECQAPLISKPITNCLVFMFNPKSLVITGWAVI